MPSDARSRLHLHLGDITTRKVDAIVNAANSSLLGGSGVDGAIHRAAGPELLWECRTVAPCPPGEARVTKGYRLPAKWVIHTVGPVWTGGGKGEAEILANCYMSALAAATHAGARSIAFSAVGTGAYGFPLAPAARIAVGEVARGLPAAIERAEFVCFTPETFAAYEAALGELVAAPV